MGVVEVEPGAFDIRLVELDRAFVLLNQIALVGRLLPGDRVFLQKLLIAGEVRPGFGEKRLIALELGLLLVERGLVWTRTSDRPP